MKSLRSDLSGSVLTMVVEVVAAHLPQVLILMLRSDPSCFYHTIVDIFLLHFFWAYYIHCCVPLCHVFLASLLHQTLPNPAPPTMPPPSTLPMTGEPAGVPQPGPSGLHRSQVLVSHYVVTRLGNIILLLLSCVLRLRCYFIVLHGIPLLRLISYRLQTCCS